MADDTLEAMCQRAIELGIPEIGFSEHWDVGPYETNPRYFKPEPWYAELERLREPVRRETGYPCRDRNCRTALYPQETAEVLQRAPFDYVIGSVHFVGRNFMFNGEYFQTHTADEVYDDYFD